VSEATTEARKFSGSTMPKHSSATLFEVTQVLRLLRQEVKLAGGPSAWARQHGANRTTVSAVLNPRRPPERKILQGLKLKKIIAYVPI
jgi:hypothetical protein